MDKSIPRIAVLFASFNGENFIEEQYASIIGQINVEVTIFFSDDCSSDSTLKKIEKFCLANRNCRLISFDNKFGSACENFLNLIINSPIDDFDYISFADQDDIWLPNKLYRAITIMNSNDASGYSSDILSWNPQKHEYKRIIKYGAQTKFDYMFQGPGPGCTFVLKINEALNLRDFLKSMPANDRKEIWFHDWFIYAYFRNNNKKWFIDSYIGMLYRQHSFNVIGSNIGIKGITDRIQILKKWRNQTIILSEIIGYANKLPLIKIKKLDMYIIKSPLKSRRKILHSLMLFIASIFRLF